MPTPFDGYLDEAGSAGTPFDAFIRPDASRQAPPGVDSHATAAVGGVYSGLADMLGAPVDAAAWGLGKIPGLDVPGDAVGGSESMRRAFGLIPGVAPSESALERRLGREPAAGERFTYRPAQEVGAALIPAAGVLGLVARGVRAAKPAGNAFVRALRDVVDTTRRAPAATTAAELGLAATAGAGAQAAREVAPDSPTAEFAGAMAGAGRGLRDRLTALRRQASERMNRRAEELGINDAEVEVDFASIADDLGDEFAPRSIFEDRKNVPEVVKLIDDIARQDREAAEAAAVMTLPKGPLPAPA